MGGVFAGSKNFRGIFAHVWFDQSRKCAEVSGRQLTPSLMQGGACNALKCSIVTAWQSSSEINLALRIMVFPTHVDVPTTIGRAPVHSVINLQSTCNWVPDCVLACRRSLPTAVCISTPYVPPALGTGALISRQLLTLHLAERRRGSSTCPVSPRRAKLPGAAGVSSALSYHCLENSTAQQGQPACTLTNVFTPQVLKVQAKFHKAAVRRFLRLSVCVTPCCASQARSGQ